MKGRNEEEITAMCVVNIGKGMIGVTSFLEFTDKKAKLAIVGCPKNRF